ncbi:MAG: PepSY domain-containing protein [Deferribacterales bacterium]
MKKLLVLTAVATLVSSAAFAWGPMGPGYGYGPGYGKQAIGQGYGPGYCGGMKAGMKGNFGPNAQFKPITEDEAKKAVEDFMKSNLKGFSIEKFEKVERPRGTAYFATVTDKKNTFEVHVNPWGRVVGPFPVQK